MLIIIVGPSASGKSFLVSELQKKGLIKKIITSTTRTPRDNEVDGVDYNFLKKEEFRKEDMAESVSFNGNMYGTPLKEILQAIDSENKYMIILEKDGAKYIKDKYGSGSKKERVISFWIRISKNKGFKRLKKRESNWKKAKIRFDNDKKNGLYNPENYDFIIENNETSEAFINKSIEIVNSI